MANALQVIKTKQFNGVKLDCYAQEGDNNDFWATREQIGQLLGYKNPEVAITKIHNRYQERFIKFSTITKLVRVEGSRIVTREVIVYNFKGLLEICRYSNQPKANAVIDFLWSVADEIRKNGFYAMNSKEVEVITTLSEQLKIERARNEVLQAQIDRIMPYSALGFVAYAMKGCITVQEGSEFLTQRGIKDMGCYNFYKWLRENEFLCRRRGSQWNHPTQKAMKDGLFNMEIGTNFKPSLRITPHGMTKFSDMIVKETLPLIFAIEATERAERIKALTV